MVKNEAWRERCKQEGTSNVIFLLQVPDNVVTGYPYHGDFCHDGEGIREGTTDDRGHWEPLDDSEYLTDDQLEDMETHDGVPCLIRKWRTIGVALTREDGEWYFKKQAYNFRDGWQVYGTVCCGSLGDIIEESGK